MRFIREVGEAAAAAFQFLSRLPVPVKLNYTDALFRRSVLFYPLVGLVLGLLLTGAGFLLQAALPPLPAAALLLAGWVGLTGALHLDGLMDTADGILSHRSRERMLEIMKDSRVGAMGVVVCVLVLILKWSLLGLLLDGAHQGTLLLLPLALIWSRFYMTAAVAGWPYARQGQEGGMGSLFRGLGARHAAGAGLVALVVSVLLAYGAAAVWPTDPVASASGPGSGWTLVWLPVTVIGVTAAAGVLISVYLSRKLGGLTGDTYGALNELLETILLLVLAGWKA